MKQNFVHFFSPGTFVSEETRKPIESWDVNGAIEMSRGILERYNALPYGFCFTTRERLDEDLDSQEVARSGMYYLGGEVFTLEELQTENDPENYILIRNMKNNSWDRIIVNKNTCKFPRVLGENDVVLDVSK